MRYRCSQCKQTTETQIGLSEAQLRVQACVACGAVGTTQIHLDSSERWWIGIRGERHGPYTLAQLAGLAGDGRISANSYVWGPNFEAWARAGQVPALADAFAARAAPPPLPPALPPATRTPARPVTRAGMLAGPGPSNEVSVSQAMPLPVEDSVIAPLVSLVGPAAAKSPPLPGGTPKPASPQPTASPAIRMDDVRRPPPTVFGMRAVTESAAVAPTAPESSPATVAMAVAPVAVPAPIIPAPAAVVPAPAAAVHAPAAIAPETATTGVSQIAETLLAPVESVTSSAAIDAPVPQPMATAPAAPVARDSGIAGSPIAPAAIAPVIKVTAATAVTNPAPVFGQPVERAPRGPALTLSRAPEPASTGGDAGLDDDFFSAASPKPSGDIFAAMDMGASKAANEGIDLSAMMSDSLSSGRVRQPTKAEMHALRQEFSVVARLEKHKRKRWLMVAAGVLFILGVVVAVVLFAPSRELEFGEHGTSIGDGGEDERPLYEVPVVEIPVVEKVAADEAPKDPKLATAPVGKNPRETNPGATRAASKVNTVATNGAAGPSTLSAERFAELTRDDLGKSELKLDFDSSEAARKADEKAAEKRSAQAGDLAERVVDAFRKKAAQFSRCSETNQERLKLQFTVTITGKVVNSTVDGTQSAAKRACVLEILGRAIFPAGSEPLTYSNTLLL